jgi:hypothetical protein
MVSEFADQVSLCSLRSLWLKFRVVRVFRGSIPGSLAGLEKAVPARLAFNNGKFARIKTWVPVFHLTLCSRTDADHFGDINEMAG